MLAIIAIISEWFSAWKSPFSQSLSHILWDPLPTTHTLWNLYQPPTLLWDPLPTTPTLLRPFTNHTHTFVRPFTNHSQLFVTSEILYQRSIMLQRSSNPETKVKCGWQKWMTKNGWQKWKIEVKSCQTTLNLKEMIQESIANLTLLNSSFPGEICANQTTGIINIHSGNPILKSP